jgi:hypothetical protein
VRRNSAKRIPREDMYSSVNHLPINACNGQPEAL